MKATTLIRMIEESKSVIIYNKDGSACMLDADTQETLLVDLKKRNVTEKAYTENMVNKCPVCFARIGRYDKYCSQCGQLVEVEA